jgi:thiol-disulfide isomerase/thioredoxin
MYNKRFLSVKCCFFWLCLFSFSCLFFTECKPTNTLISPGRARLSGKIAKEVYYAQKDTTNKVIGLLPVTHFSDPKIDTILLDNELRFVIDIPVVCPTLCEVVFDGYVIGINLTPGKETQFELILDETRKKSLKMITGTGSQGDDYSAAMPEYVYMLQGGIDQKWMIQKEMQADEYNRHILTNLEEMDKALNESTIQDNIKSILKEQIKLFYLVNAIFDYDVIYYPQNHIPRPLKKPSDFAFLQYFNLADSTIVRKIDYGRVFDKILADSILNIPPIGEKPVADWLKEVKPIMSGLIGTDSGLFYDLLVANAYSRDIYKKIQPFSVKQIDNIKSYFSNSSYIELLLSANETIIEISKGKTNETPLVPKEELMDAIVSKYKGKVVVVDFWATWCGPCIEAIRKIKDIKNAMNNKNVVFVYITDSSSEIGVWKGFIHNVSGEHYYLTKAEWDYLSESFDIKAIPAYLFYDVNGVLKHRRIGYPGNEEMQKMIEDLLP